MVVTQGANTTVVSTRNFRKAGMLKLQLTYAVKIPISVRYRLKCNNTNHLSLKEIVSVILEPTTSLHHK